MSKVNPYFGGKRELAFLVDAAISLFLFFFLSVFGMVLGPVYLLFKDSFEGRSIGKRLFRLKVVDFKTGKVIGPAQSFIRNITLMIIIDIPIMIIQEYYTRKPSHRRPGDFLAKTAVVKEGGKG